MNFPKPVSICPVIVPESLVRDSGPCMERAGSSGRCPKHDKEVVVNTPSEKEVEAARAAVREHGAKQYPVGEDRAALCHAALVLDREVERLRLRTRMFPIQSSKGRPTFTSCSWDIAEKAYSDYRRRFGDSQSLERLAERHGFDASEMDDHYPAWEREETERRAGLESVRVENTSLRAQVKYLESELVTRAENAERRLDLLEKRAALRKGSGSGLNEEGFGPGLERIVGPTQ